MPINALAKESKILIGNNGNEEIMDMIPMFSLLYELIGSDGSVLYCSKTRIQVVKVNGDRISKS